MVLITDCPAILLLQTLLFQWVVLSVAQADRFHLRDQPSCWKEVKGWETCPQVLLLSQIGQRWVDWGQQLLQVWMNLPPLSPLLFFLKWDCRSYFFVGCLGIINTAEILQKASKYLRHSWMGFPFLLLLFWPELTSRNAQCLHNLFINFWLSFVWLRFFWHW